MVANGDRSFHVIVAVSVWIMLQCGVGLSLHSKIHIHCTAH